MPTSLYKPLDTRRSEIRLLSFIPCRGPNSTLQCCLETVSLIKNPTYTALSYIWGDASRTEDITVNGVVVAVTTNLAAALRHCCWYAGEHQSNTRAKSLRLMSFKKPAPFRLWADAICINQKDIPERSHQVTLMKPIYQQAVSVLCWLGADHDFISLALQQLNVIGKEVENSGAKPMDYEWMKKHPHLYGQDEPNAPFQNKAWNAIENFLRFTYWRRVWILQELVLGRALRLSCGTCDIDYEVLKSAMGWASNFSTTEIFQQRRISKPQFIYPGVWRALLDHGMRWSELHVVEYARTLRINNLSMSPMRHNLIFRRAELISATDPKDHVYGLLGITRSGIVPDYNKSVAEVYTEFMKFWVEDLHDMSPLITTGIGLQLGNEYGLPSWTPNLSALSRNTIGWDPIRAPMADRSEEDWSVDHSVPFIQGFHLIAFGACVGTISTVHTSLDSHSLLNGNLLKYFGDFVSRSNEYLPGVPPLQAVFRTMLHDRDPQSEQRLALNNSRTHVLAGAFLQSLLFSSHSASTSTLNSRLQILGFANDDNFVNTYKRLFFPGQDKQHQSLCKSAQELCTVENPLSKTVILVRNKIPLALARHRLFETARGHLGLAPMGAAPGDIICELKKCEAPVVLREVGSHYLYVGTCFVLGRMHGEISEGWGKKTELDRFEIH